MAVTNNFVAVNWNANQLIDEDSLDQINANLNWLKNNSLTGQLQNTTGYPTSTGLKILAGKTVIPGLGLTDIYSDVYFAKAFTPNSSPVVTFNSYIASWVCDENLIALDGTGNLDHRGFRVHLQSNVHGPFPVNPVINWIAIGY